MKGIVLAGGSGTRLYPITKSISKQIIPVYDKPMIYYPVSVLLLAGIRDILIISTPHDLPLYKHLFGDGSDLGVNFTYAEQPSPDGLAQAFIIGEEFIGDDHVCMVLGDNIFYGYSMSSILKEAAALEDGAVVFGYYVNDPERYGVLNVKTLGRGVAWLDTGTHDSLLEASNFISTIQNRQGLQVACLEEIVYQAGYIDKEQLLKLAEPLKKNFYGQYLIKIANAQNHVK